MTCRSQAWMLYVIMSEWMPTLLGSCGGGWENGRRGLSSWQNSELSMNMFCGNSMGAGPSISPGKRGLL